MLKFEANKTAAVADGTRVALASYDEAIGSAASLTLSFLDAVQGSDLPANEVQKFVQTVHDSTGGLINGRAGMVSAVARTPATGCATPTTTSSICLREPGTTPPRA